MRKRIAFRKLSRTSSHKWAMLRNMATSLIEHERIVTTLPKAKELRRLADHLITLAKRGEIHHRQQANAILRTKPSLSKLFDVLGPRYKERQGGYTRILKLAKPRQGDNAPMAVMEYIDRPGELRAARPPSSRQMDVLAGVLRRVGLTPLQDMEEAEIVAAVNHEIEVGDEEEENVDDLDARGDDSKDDASASDRQVETSSAAKETPGDRPTKS